MKYPGTQITLRFVEQHFSGHPSGFSQVIEDPMPSDQSGGLQRAALLKLSIMVSFRGGETRVRWSLEGDKGVGLLRPFRHDRGL